MKKPALIRTTVRFFPDEESEATTATPFTMEGYVTDSLFATPYSCCYWRCGNFAF